MKNNFSFRNVLVIFCVILLFICPLKFICKLSGAPYIVLLVLSGFIAFVNTILNKVLKDKNINLSLNQFFILFLKCICLMFLIGVIGCLLVDSITSLFILINCVGTLLHTLLHENQMFLLMGDDIPSSGNILNKDGKGESSLLGNILKMEGKGESSKTTTTTNTTTSSSSVSNLDSKDSKDSFKKISIKDIINENTSPSTEDQKEEVKTQEVKRYLHTGTIGDAMRNLQFFMPGYNNNNSSRRH